MKNLIFLLTFSSIFFLACNDDSNAKKAIPDSELWATFKSDFQNVVAKNDLQGVVKLIDFPLEGNFYDRSKLKGFSKNGVLKNYGKIIGNKVRLRVKDAKKEEWSEMKVGSEEESKRFGLPVGKAMKVLTLNFVFDEGKENQTESTQIFYFAKIDGDYKWCAMEVAG